MIESILEILIRLQIVAVPILIVILYLALRKR